MKKNSDLLKNLHKTISTCSKKNRKLFEEELEGMSRKIEGMIKEELKTYGDKVDLDQLSIPLDNIGLKVIALKDKVEKIVMTLSVEANNSLNEIYNSFRGLEEIKEQIIKQNLENISEMGLIRKKILRNLKKDKDVIKKSIKKYKWVDL